MRHQSTECFLAQSVGGGNFELCVCVDFRRCFAQRVTAVHGDNSAWWAAQALQREPNPTKLVRAAYKPRNAFQSDRNNGTAFSQLRSYIQNSHYLTTCCFFLVCYGGHNNPSAPF